MKFAPLAAAVLALAGLAAQAQTPPPPAPPGATPMQRHEGGMQQHMQERRQDRMQRRMESLKRILQITPAQEGAWNAWTAAMKPPARDMQQQRQGHEEFARLSTPERIDRMRQLRAQRAAEMDKRGDATKTFYAQLTPPQQKAFDEVSLKFLGRHGRGGPGRGRHMGA